MSVLPYFLVYVTPALVLTGALLGGIVLAMLESFAGAYMSAFTDGAFGAEYKDIFAFSILILVLIFRPSGLLGEQVGQKA